MQDWPQEGAFLRSLGPAEQFFGGPDECRCSECKREPREDERPEDEWRVESDGVGELHTFCPECWEREFGEGRLD